MKKILIAICLLSFMVSPSQAFFYVDPSINSDSFTTTNDNYVKLSTAVGTDFVGVCVGSPTIGGVTTVFDGQNIPFVSSLAVVNMNTQGCQIYNVAVSSGLFYRTTGNGVNGVAIIYRNRTITP